ncbi:MAG: alpha-glucosidase, partial [Spirochaetaceae bacterium]|nr:alpha-glucosidase [Spirochaetaceae bacterium]
TSRRLSYHLDTSAYAAFDFRGAGRHELAAWALPDRLFVGAADTMRELVSGVSAGLGRQGELPDWAYDGVVLGIQGGTAACLEKLARARAAGVPVCGIWAQDWQGINITSFGQRLRWNWEWDAERYPRLDEEIVRLRAEGVRFLGYVNPYVAAGRPLFAEAAERGFLAKNAAGGDYLVDFGEFDAGIVDFTIPAAVEWYKGVIGRNLIGLGLSGWMADFGEYLPTDAVLGDGTPAEIAHNAWPAIWARVNREAVDEAGPSSFFPGGAAAEVLYFMRAGFTGSQRWCPLMWAGDQNVDWSKDDGLPSVIPAALSLAVSGHGLHHSDIGGYTTLFGMKRTKELFLRWAEQAALTPFMRSHEGNRPKDNWQFDSDEETLAGLGRMGRFHAALKPYLKACVAENARDGVPVMRPLFLSFEGDAAAWELEDEYLLGPDLLAAPVLEEGAVTRRLHLPPGAWIHLWSGGRFEAPSPGGAEIEVAAPLGEPPAFLRAGSAWEAVFAEAVRAAGARPPRGSIAEPPSDALLSQGHV